jgi:hypothetical protein
MLNQHPALAELRLRIRFLEGAWVREGSVLLFGLEAIDAHLPGGGLQAGALHEAFRSAGEAAPWSPLSTDVAAATYYFDPREIELYRTDTGNYRHNLASELPPLWIVLRRPFELHTVTAGPG